MGLRNRIVETDSNTAVNKYCTDINKSKPLTIKEERRLWEQYKQNNDIVAKNKLIEANLKFVLKVANVYKGRGVPLEDIIEDGNLGLLKAMETFNGHYGVKFISYAVWWIKQEITEAIKAKNEIFEENLETDDKEDTEEGVCEIEDLGYGTIDEYEEINNERQKQWEYIKSLLSVLNKREQEIVLKFYGFYDRGNNNTLERISQDFNITKERTRQILENAKKKMRCYALEKSEIMTIY